VTSFKNIL